MVSKDRQEKTSLQADNKDLCQNSSRAVQPRQAAAPQAGEAQKALNAAKPKQEWKSKNFMSDDDEFEYDFLNWEFLPLSSFE